MKAGVGQSGNSDSFRAGTECALKAMENGRIQKPCCVIAFCQGTMNHDEFKKGILSVTGIVPVIGGSAVGIITSDIISYSGFFSAAAVLEGDFIPEISEVCNISQNGFLAGEKLSEAFKNAYAPLALFMFDSICKEPDENSPPIMNESAALIDGILRNMNTDIPLIGVGLIGSFGFTVPKMFTNTNTVSDSAQLILFNGGFTPYITITHGCTPLDGVYYTITKIEGNILYELNGKPAAEIVNSVYGDKSWHSEKPITRISFGLNYGEKFRDFDEDNYVNRLITGLLPDGGVALFESGLKAGDEVQLMIRDSSMMLDSVEKKASELIKQIRKDGKKPVFALYIDCAGRSTALPLSDSLDEEADILRNIMNKNEIPLLGLYSGVEIGMVAGKPRGLDWTGVITVLAEGEHD